MSFRVVHVVRHVKKTPVASSESAVPNRDGQRHVIILAQGQQSRMPDLPIPKQAMALPLCGRVSIIGRTIYMARDIDPQARITVVAEWSMLARIMHPALSSLVSPMISGMAINDPELEEHELADPGNSSLKGISRYLDYRRDCQNLAAEKTFAQTVVLLGDCVYSWHCLELLMRDTIPYVFVGTSNLSESEGEIWGIAWTSEANETMTDWLKKALRRHPPFEKTYQCGQLRQWLFTARRDNDPHPVIYTSVDDYTKDFDVPADLDHLLSTSGHARMDDRQHGIDWGRATVVDG
jgi:hypothetical protein